MTIFLKGKLETLRYFIDEMAVRTRDAVFIDTTDPLFFAKIINLDNEINENTHVITFNNAGVNLPVGEGKNYWEIKKVKLHNILVDAPIWYKSTLDLHLNCMQIVSVDEYHNQFIKRFYPIYSNSIFVPHGGTGSQYVQDYDDREIEVLYLGGKQEVGKQIVELPMFADKGKNMREIFMQLMMENPSLPVEVIMDIYIREMAPELTEQMQIICIYAIYMDVVRYIRGMYQEKIVETLAQAGIPVTIYSGGSWYKLGEKYPKNICVKERVSSAKCIKLIGNSKICLNIQPWFKAGAHERVFNAMLNEAVCVTDTSEYLLQNFTHGRDIVFYELEHLEQLSENIKYLLANPECAKFIIQNQKRRAANQTWADRLDEIIGSQWN